MYALFTDPIGDDDSDHDVENETYDSFYRSDWLLIELNHKVSKTATDLFWKTALLYIHKLKSAPGNKATHQFKTIRKKLYEGNIPDIHLEIGYKDRTTGKIDVVEDISTPVRQFPPSKFEKLFEIASIKVS